MPDTAGYMMLAGHFRRNLVSSGDLNRRSQDGVPCAFYVTFCTMQKVTSRSPSQGAPRFYEPRISAQNYKFALTKLNPFAALRRPFPTFCKVQKVGQKTLELSFRKVCPIRCSTLRVLFPPPLVAFFGGSAAFFLLFV